MSKFSLYFIIHVSFYNTCFKTLETKHESLLTILGLEDDYVDVPMLVQLMAKQCLV